MAPALPTCKSPPILATAVRGANGRGRAAPDGARGVSLLHLRQQNGPGARTARAFAVGVGGVVGRGPLEANHRAAARRPFTFEFAALSARLAAPFRRACRLPWQAQR